MTCRECGRKLIPASEWDSKTRTERKNLNRRAARAKTRELCARDHQRLMRSGQDPTVPYFGGWIRVGHVLRPDPNGAPLTFFGETT